MENKPNVFPSQEQIKEANEMGTKIAEQFEKENQVIPIQKSRGEIEAAERMKMDSLALLEEQMRKRDELIARKKAEEQGQEFNTEDPYAPKTAPITYATIENNIEHAKLEIPEDKQPRPINID